MTINSQKVLALAAHPDDVEFYSAGTLVLLQRLGWEIHIATVARGDCGTAQLSREEISRIRKEEAVQSAALLGGTYHCLEEDDVFIMYDRPTLMKAIKLMRKIKPAIVFTLSHSDYMVDHENAAKLATTACLAAGIRNIDTSPAKPFGPVPHLYYGDPPQGIDIYGKEIEPQMWVDISPAIDTKTEMLSCHTSQREWLRVYHGHDEYIDSMRQWSQQRGEQINCAYAEAFRQHLGEIFPTDNILKTVLGDAVHLAPVV